MTYILPSRAARTVWPDPSEVVCHIDTMRRAVRAGRVPINTWRIQAGSIVRDVEATIRSLVDDGRQDWRPELDYWFQVRRMARHEAGMIV